VFPGIRQGFFLGGGLSCVGRFRPPSVTRKVFMNSVIMKLRGVAALANAFTLVSHRDDSNSMNNDIFCKIASHRFEEKL